MYVCTATNKTFVYVCTIVRLSLYECLTGIDPNNAWVYDDDDDKMSEPDTDPPDI